MPLGKSHTSENRAAGLPWLQAWLDPAVSPSLSSDFLCECLELHFACQREGMLTTLLPVIGRKEFAWHSLPPSGVSHFPMLASSDGVLVDV